MTKTLYRTYRPQKFSDVIGQDHITKTLQNAITSNRIGHAYLFTGPRGTGKTTVARLFATAVNSQKRDAFDSVSKEIKERLISGNSMDVIEIDAASNTGVDDIRALKETVGVTPTETKYKVYIIDEVHMLSSNAFNALLKTLEEPPAHTIFILATTEIHKVPDTIISRCQRFDFARFSIDNIIKKLKLIAEKENVKISKEALEMVAISAQGGMRDAESLLAQIFALEDKNITAEEVSRILGTTTSADVLAFISSLTCGDIETAFTTIDNTVRGGYNMETFIRLVIEKLRITLFLSISSSEHKNIRNLVSIPKSEITDLQNSASQTTTSAIIIMIEECTAALQKTKNTTIIQLPLEVAVVNICNTSKKSSSNTTKNTKSDNGKEVSTQSPKKISEPTKNITKSIKNEEAQKQWHKCIAKVEPQNKSLADLLSQCEVAEISSTAIVLHTTFSFYKDKITEGNNRMIIETAIKDIFSTPTKIKIEVQDKKEKDSKSSELLSYATQIMNSPTVTE